jgi:hypothetical protein
MLEVLPMHKMCVATTSGIKYTASKSSGHILHNRFNEDRATRSQGTHSHLHCNRLRDADFPFTRSKHANPQTNVQFSSEHKADLTVKHPLS